MTDDLRSNLQNRTMVNRSQWSSSARGQSQATSSSTSSSSSATRRESASDQASSQTFRYNRVTQRYENDANYIDQGGYEREKETSNISQGQTKDLVASGRTAGEIAKVNQTEFEREKTTRELANSRGEVPLNYETYAKIQGISQNRIHTEMIYNTPFTISSVKNNQRTQNTQRLPSIMYDYPANPDGSIATNTPRQTDKPSWLTKLPGFSTIDKGVSNINDARAKLAFMQNFDSVTDFKNRQAKLGMDLYDTWTGDSSFGSKVEQTFAIENQFLKTDPVAGYLLNKTSTLFRSNSAATVIAADKKFSA